MSLHPRGLIALSSAGSNALAEALRKLPNDLADPVPLCERIAQLLDVVVPLTESAELSDEDRAILVEFCQSDQRLLRFAEMSRAVDVETLESRLRAFPSIVTIHVLDNSFPLCGFSRDLPGQWPTGHIGIYPEEYLVTYAACLDPEHELHAVVRYVMCEGCEREMTDSGAS
jgi:hypothetical protein